MSRRESSLAAVLLTAPWWASLIVGAIGFVGLRWVPSLVISHQFTFREAFIDGLQKTAPFVFGAFVIVSVFSALIGLIRKLRR